MQQFFVPNPAKRKCHLKVHIVLILLVICFRMEHRTGQKKKLFFPYGMKYSKTQSTTGVTFQTPPPLPMKSENLSNLRHVFVTCTVLLK